MYAFIDASTNNEVETTNAISDLVDTHWKQLISHTSPRMGKILKKLVVRTKWDSTTQDKYGEYFGVPAPRSTPYDSGVLPPEIVVFAHPLARDFPSKEELSNKIRLVLIHEIGHHLGLSEAELRRRKIY